MLQVKSFPITDADGINALLKEYRLAPEAHILVSDGHVCIPFEDGEPMNNTQRAAMLKEMKGRHLQERYLIEHSEEVNKLQIADAQEALNAIKAAEPKGEGYVKAEVKKEYEEKLKAAENRLSQLQTLSLQNKSEIARININIDVLDATVAGLE